MVIFMVNVIIILMAVDSADKRVQSVGCGAMWTSLTHARMPHPAQKVLIFTGLARLVESDKRLAHAWF